MSDLRPLQEWSGPPAALTLWLPTAAARECARQASASPVPPSYEQEQHLRAFRACAARGEEMARLLIVVWEETGRCDLRAMTHVLNAHLCRHDTYHSRFAAEGDVMRRHVLADPPPVLLETVGVGDVNAGDWRRHVMATPTPFKWDCFRFGILQRPDGFTFFASIDHLHADSTLIAFLMEEVHMAYAALIDGEPPPRLGAAGCYLDYCIDQRQRTEALTRVAPGVSAWVDFLERNAGRMPAFRLQLGISDNHCLAEHLNVEILDPSAMAAFEAACLAAGARVIGGVLAVAALAERTLAGPGHYAVVTPTTTRKSPEAFRTMGWCMGVVPVDFAAQEGGFGELAVAAQRSFDTHLPLSAIPIERVLELTASMPTIRPTATGGVMLSYMDVNLPPMSAHIAGQWQQRLGRVYINQGMAAQVALWFFRTETGLSLTAAYPANAIAAKSMQRYIGALRETFVQASAGR